MSAKARVSYTAIQAFHYVYFCTINICTFVLVILVQKYTC
jgi:hypothetical protein